MDETASDHRFTTITLFSNLLFKGVGRRPKTGKKKGGIKVHTVIHANEGVPSDIKFTSAATNDSFMLKPTTLNEGDIKAMDRAYIANLLLMVMQKGLKRQWSFSGPATMVRITLMYYLSTFELFGEFYMLYPYLHQAICSLIHRI